MTTLRILPLLAVLAAPGLAEAKITTTFLGWSADGTYYVERQENDTLKSYVNGDFVSVPYYLFVPTRSDVKPTWPTKLAPYPKRDEYHAIVPASALGADDKAALAAVRALVTAPAPAATGPGGLKLASEPRGEDVVYVVTAGDRRLPMRPQIGGFTIRETYWRADGGAVALVVENTSADTMYRGSRQVFAYDLSRYLVAGGDRKAATALRKGAAKSAKRKDWGAALDDLQEAVNLDPGFVDARYELAAAAARRGLVATVERELGWLAASPDPLAAKALRKAAADAAFDRATTHDTVRTLLGLGAYGDLPADQRIAGTWTLEGGACDASWLTLTLAKKGKATLRVRSVCQPEHARAWDRTSNFTGTWTTDGTQTSVTLKMPVRDDAPQAADVEARTCPDGWCLFLTGSETSYGPFHRGEPQ